ncbi:probable RNA-binding protein 19 [Halyomorpha halys]|uniref:probable RNA-binding protein 19 n=1 Tax=Halyomorpha halys TaxID=286706 RepID=UPI000D0C8FAF|nr:probable RNA-binding protein 19 [Halyomorpha halys]
MSRIIIKNLPTNVSADKLKEKFSEFGRITDVQLKYTPNGKFRNFAFIGYETGDEADNAIKALDKSFIGTNRIQVETCAGLGDSNKPKAWSKYAPDSTAYKKIHGKQLDSINNILNEISTKKKKKNIKPEIIESLKKHLEDPNFLEYLEVCGKKNLITRIIKEHVEPEAEEENTEQNEDLEIKKEDEKEEDKTTSAAFSSISDLEYLKLKTKGISYVNEVPFSKTEDKTEPKIKLFNIKISNLPFKTKKKDIKELLKPLVPASIRFIGNVKGVAYVGFKTEKELRQAMVKNKTFLSGKQLLFSEVEEKVKATKPDKWKQQEESLKNEESIAESGRIFIRNLPYSVNEEELQSLFSSFGPVTEVIIPVDKFSRQVRGYGIVTFLMPEHAVAAYCKLDGTVFHGRMLHLLPGKAKEEEKDSDIDGPYKLKKEKKLKASAGSSHNWNTLFLDLNAVAEVIAGKYESTKEQILTGNDAAVRLALGETQLVNETRQFLEDNGVFLDAFNQEVKTRSKTVILVKNLPAKTTAGEVRNLFAKYGELGRIVLPPSGVTGIVEFLEPSEARAAFKQLAYTKFKHLPLYLEWAPNNTFQGSNEESEEKNKDSTVKVESSDDKNIKEESKDVKVVKTESDGEEDLVPEPNTTLFVKNLNFETTDESLKKHFSGCGKIASAQVSKKKDAQNPGKLLSMGYGFVQYYQQSSVVEALKNLQGSKLDGHALELKRSNRTLSSDAVLTRKKTNLQTQTGSKIVVRNVPFQATVKEIGDLFRTFGEVKFVRLPKKLVGTGPHRGFGFVEFISKNDAKRAMKALCQSTHLYGRRLVLEWAKEDEGINELRKRTAQHFHSDTADSNHKKAKADIPIEGEEEEQEMLDM